MKDFFAQGSVLSIQTKLRNYATENPKVCYFRYFEMANNSDHRMALYVGMYCPFSRENRNLKTFAC